MNKNEYFSNCYRTIISNKIFHLIMSLSENLLTLMVQSIIYFRKFTSDEENISFSSFHLILRMLIDMVPLLYKLILIIIIDILIIIYYLIYNRFSFQKKSIFNRIIINLNEIVIFRLLFIIFCHIAFSINKDIELLICFFFTIPTFVIIIKNFYMNHLYYFSPHFVNYPYDYYSSFIDIIHLIEKIFIILSLQSTNIYLMNFLFMISFFLQIFSFLYSVYIINFKSYYFMNNIFLNKARFSFLLSTLLNNLIMIILGKKNIEGFNSILIIISVYIIFFIIFQIFYDPYKYVFFGTEENISNIYFYFFIIDHLRNETFLLEETLEKHHSTCKNCELCKKLNYYLSYKIDHKNLYKILYKDVWVLSKIINEIIHTLLFNENN